MKHGVGLPPLDELFASLGPVVVVRSAMGTGKSRAFLEYIAVLPPDVRVLVLANRLSILRNLAGRSASTGLVLHSDVKERRLDLVARLLCTVESLARLLDETGRLPLPYDLVVIDELPATLGQLLSPTVRDRALVVEIFRNVIFSAKAVVGFAADAEESDAITLGALAGQRVSMYVNRTLPDPGTLHIFRDRLEWETEVARRIGSGRRAFLASDSRRVLENLLDKLSPVIAGRAVRSYAAGYGADAAAELADPNRSWLQYDVVAATPVITHGVDFSVPDHFDFVGYVATGTTLVPRVVVQTLRRVRHPASGEILVLVSRDDASEPPEPTLGSTDPHRYVTTLDGRVVPDESDPLTLLAVKAASERVDRRSMAAEIEKRWIESGGSVIRHEKPAGVSDEELVALGFEPDGDSLVRWIADGETVRSSDVEGWRAGVPLVKSLRARLKLDGRKIERVKRCRRTDGYVNLFAIKRQKCS